MDYTSDQALNQKERKTLEQQIQLKKSIEIVDSTKNVFHDQNEVILMTNQKEINSGINIIENVLNCEPEIVKSDSPMFIDHSEQHSQEETTEISNSGKPEHIKLQIDYKSLLQSYNCISQAFHSHVSLMQSSSFLEQLKILKADNEKLKNESHFYFSQAQNLLLENHRLQHDHSHASNFNNLQTSFKNLLMQDFSNKNTIESLPATFSLNHELHIAKEIMAKQENDIQALRYELTQLNELKKKHEELASENSKLNIEIGLLSEKKNILEKDMQILNEKSSTQEKYLGKLKIHRELLFAEKGYLKETIKELENYNQKSNLFKDYERLEEIRKNEAENLEKKIKRLEEKLNDGIETENFKQKCSEKSEKLKDSEANCREILHKLQKYKVKCENLEKDKKLKEDNLEELKRSLNMLRGEFAEAEKNYKISAPSTLIKLVTLLHKSKKLSLSSSS